MIDCSHDFKVRRAVGNGPLVTQTLCTNCGCSPAYAEYMQKVRIARSVGYSNAVIIDELQRERTSIMPRCMVKQATLAMDRNVYKKRQAAAAAHECIVAIDRICKELSEDGSPTTIGNHQKETQNG